MSRIVVVHGIAQQHSGARSLHASIAPALLDGVELAGGHVDAADISVAFYGDLFRPRGRSVARREYDASDVENALELALLKAWADQATRLDPVVQHRPARARSPQWVQRALATLASSAYFAGLSEHVLIGALKQVRIYLEDTDVRTRVQDRVAAAVSDRTVVVVGHSLGSVIAYELLCAIRNLPVTDLVTLGSPLGVPNLIFDRLIPPPESGTGFWPGSVQSWTNVSDSGDIVALPKHLAPLFNGPVRDVSVHNGAKAHDIRPYLTARETGAAILAGLESLEG